jgi:hypothetical protein
MRPRRDRQKPGRRALTWSATSSHSFDLEVKRPRWPPFYATAAFLPRVKVRLRNMGEMVPRASVEASVSEYEGPIGSANSHAGPWEQAAHEFFDEPWPPAAARKLTINVPSRALPRSGTYLLRISVTQWHPQGTPYEEMLRTLRESEVKLTEVQRDAAISVSKKFLEESGVDPHKAQPGAFRGEPVFTGTVFEYFRVESLASVLAFWLVSATLMLVIATLILAVTALAGG